MEHEFLIIDETFGKAKYSENGRYVMIKGYVPNQKVYRNDFVVVATWPEREVLFKRKLRSVELYELSNDGISLIVLHREFNDLPTEIICFDSDGEISWFKESYCSIVGLCFSPDSKIVSIAFSGDDKYPEANSISVYKSEDGNFINGNSFPRHSLIKKMYFIDGRLKVEFH